MKKKQSPAGGLRIDVGASILPFPTAQTQTPETSPYRRAVAAWRSQRDWALLFRHRAHLRAYLESREQS